MHAVAIDQVHAGPTPAADRRAERRGPTWVRSLDTRSLHDRGMVIVTFLDGRVEEFSLYDPAFHDAGFRECRRRMPERRARR